MPDGTPAPVPGQAQPQQQPQAPFGQSPAVQPTPNRGHEAAAGQALGLIVERMTQIIPMAGAGSDLGQALLDAVKKLAKFVPAGSVTPASRNNQLQEMAMKQGQANQQMEQLRQMRMGQQGQQQQQPMKAA